MKEKDITGGSAKAEPHNRTTGKNPVGWRPGFSPAIWFPHHLVIIRTVKKLRVGVIYGGRSGEHEVSVASAASIIKNLDRTRYEPLPIRIEKDGRWTIADGRRPRSRRPK